MTQAIIVDGAGAVVFALDYWAASVFADKIAELCAATPDCPVAGVALGPDAPAVALSWEGCPYRILPCSTDRPTIDPVTQVLGQAVITVDGDVALATYSATDKPLSEAKAAKLEALAKRRWEVECGGITMPDGSIIATDDRSKTLLNGKYRTAEKFPDRLHRWKGSGGEEITLTSAQVIAIGDAVSDHVQACFDRELDLIAEIGGATTTVDVRGIDILAGW